MSDLTPKQARFVEEYLIDLNATQAAIRAGYSTHTADVQGSRLLSNVKVAAAIQAAQTVLSEPPALREAGPERVRYVLENHQAVPRLE